MKKKEKEIALLKKLKKEYDEVDPAGFINGHIAAKKDDKWFSVNMTGKPVNEGGSVGVGNVNSDGCLHLYDGYQVKHIFVNI